MLDIRYIRENADLVQTKSEQKGYKVDVKHLLELDEQRRQLLGDIEMVRAERNKLADDAKGQKPSDEQTEHGKHLKQHLSECEDRLKPVDEEFEKLLKAIPNMPTDDVPVGASEADNIIAKTVGEPTKFDFQPKNHWEIAELWGWIDKTSAAKVSGARFAYIAGDLVRLQFAIIQYVLDTLGNQDTIQKLIDDNNLKLEAKAFIPILPPVMIREEIYDQMDRLEPREDRYHLQGEDDNLWLIGSAEHTLGSMYVGQTLDESSLPLRYIGYSTSFRQEAGTYGKDNEGILRMHQFDKLEMEVFSTAETGLDEHKLLIAIQEYLTQQLGIPYHMLMKCTADIGKPNARGVDLEAWLPGQDKYRETHTADYMTDYQARRLKTRYKEDSSGEIKLVHTNDATAFALGRTMIAIIENFQTHDGHVKVPAVLQKYLNGQTEL